MSRVNDPRRPDQSSASPIRNLFKQNDTPAGKLPENESSIPKAPAQKPNGQPPHDFRDDDDTSDIYGEITDNEPYEPYREEPVSAPAPTEDPEREVVYEESSPKKKGKRFGKLKERFQKLVDALKQQPEAEDYNDETDEELDDEETGVDLNAAKSIYRPDHAKEPQQEEADPKTVEAIRSIMEKKHAERAGEHPKPPVKAEPKPEAEKPPVKVELKPADTKAETKAEPKPEAEKPPFKVELKPADTKAESKAEPKPETEKSPVKVELKPADTKAESKAEPKPETEKPPVKVELKPADTKAESKAEPKPETEKPPVRVELKPTDAKAETKAETKPETEKPPVKVELKPADAKTETKAEPKPETEKPPVKVELKPADTKTETKAEPKPETEKPPVKVELKPADTKTETKAEPMPEAEKPPVKVELKPADTKAESKAEPKPETEKPPVKVELKPADAKAETKTEPKPEAEKPPVKVELKPADTTLQPTTEAKPDTAKQSREEPRAQKIYEAPKAPTIKLPPSSRQTPPHPAEKIEDVMPKGRNERPKKELPVFDIFAEFAKEQAQKGQEEKKPTPAVKAEETAKSDSSAPAQTEKAAKQETAAPVKAEETASSDSSAPAQTGKAAKQETAAPVKAEETASSDSSAPAQTEKAAKQETAAPAKAKETPKAEPTPAVQAKEAAASVETEPKTSDPIPAPGTTAPFIRQTAVPAPPKTAPEADSGVPQNDIRLMSPYDDADSMAVNDTLPISLSLDEPSRPETAAPTEQPGPVPDEDDPRFRADDLPGGDGIRIIPWEPPKKPEPEPEPPAAPENDLPEDADLSEGQISAVTYHYSSAEPFIVMAGKFSRTLRSEYEAIMAYRHRDDPNYRPPAPPRAPVPPMSDKPRTSQKPAAAPPAKKPASPAPAKQQTAKADAPKAKAPKVRLPKAGVPKTKAPLTAVISESTASAPVRKETPSMPAVTEAPGTEASKPVKEKKAKKAAVFKNKKEKKKRSFDFRALFNTEEEYDPDDLPVGEETKPQLDDFNEESDAEAISTEIATTFQTVFGRTVTLLATTVVSVILALLAQCTPLFRETIHNGWLWYAIISFLLFAVSAVVYRMPIVNGLMELRRFKGNPDTAIAVACVAVAIQSVTAIFTPEIFINGTLHIYVPLVLLGLLLNSLGKLVLLMRTHRNFIFLKKPFPKFAGKIFTDMKNAEEMVKELPTRKPLIAYTKRSSFMSNFLQLSYQPDPSEEAASKLAPITTVLALVGCLFYGIIYKSFTGAVSVLALLACMAIPMICLLAINLPLKRLCKSVLKSGAMITGYETVKQFCDTNAIMIDSSQLYPRGSVTLSGIKTFKQSKLNDALMAGAAIMNVVNGNMIYVFENIVQCSKDSLPNVDNVFYEDGLGIVGWVRGQRVLIGNRAHLVEHNIQPPALAEEELHTKRGFDVTYITVGGDLIAMLILSYKTDRNISRELRSLEQNGVSLIVRTVDSNLTREKVAERFGLFHRSVTILNTTLGQVCQEAIDTPTDRSRAYLVTRGKLSSFAKAISGCIRLKTTATITRLLQYIAIIFGLALVILISFVSGFDKLGILQMLIYIGFWSITSLIVSLIRK